MDTTASKLVFPLNVVEGTSRYQPGTYYYLNDSGGNLLAGTQDTRKVELWRELAAVTHRMVLGEPLALNEVSRVVGHTVDLPLRITDPTALDDGIPF